MPPHLLPHLLLMLLHRPHPLLPLLMLLHLLLHLLLLPLHLLLPLPTRSKFGYSVKKPAFGPVFLCAITRQTKFFVRGDRLDKVEDPIKGSPEKSNPVPYPEQR
jgi:hypothetical protein